MKLGTGSQDFTGDGGPATSAQLEHLEFITVDTSNRIYLSHSGLVAIQFWALVVFTLLFVVQMQFVGYPLVVPSIVSSGIMVSLILGRIRRSLRLVLLR